MYSSLLACPRRCLPALRLHLARAARQQWLPCPC